MRSPGGIGDTGDDTPYTEWWRRAVAVVIDYLLIAAALAIVLNGFDLTTFDETADGDLQPRFTVLGVALTLVVPIVYFAVLTARTGRTVGKRAMGCRVVSVDGHLLDLPSAFLRSAVLCLGVQTCVLGIVDNAWALWDPQCQTLHDRAAGSIVVDG